MAIQARFVSSVNWQRAAPSSYVVSIPHAADPTTSTKLTIALPGSYANKQSAALAAVNHLNGMSDAELQVLLTLEPKQNDPLGRSAN